MKKLIKLKPTPHSVTSAKEADSVYTFQSIVDANYIKCDIRVQDKLPNIDGYIEVTDIDGVGQAKLEVQIKTINSKYLSKPFYQTDLRFISYCEECVSPVLLIVMNKEHDLGYWIYIDKELISEISAKLKENQKTVKIKFSESCKITRDNKNYIKSWYNIFINYRNLIRTAHSIGLENKKLKGKLAKLSKSFSNEKVDEQTCFEIHKFLDRLHYSIEHEYSIVKSIMYKDVWKFGFAFILYSDVHVDFILFPILYRQNNLQIRKLKNLDAIGELDEFGIVYYGNPHANLIKSNPQKVIDWFVRDKLEYILQWEKLTIPSVLVAQEFLISFIENYAPILNLKIDNYVLISDLEYSFQYYLPLWLDEYLIYLNDFSTYEINLDEVFMFTNHTEISTITSNLNYKLLETPTLKSSSDFTLESTHHPLDKFYSYINLLKQNRKTQIINPYSQGIKVDKIEYFIWETYTPDSLCHDVNVMYQSLPKVYEDMISLYFPVLKDKLSYFQNFNLIVIIVYAPTNGLNITGEPSMDTFYLQSVEPSTEKDVKVYVNIEIEGLNVKNMLGIVTLNNKDYMLLKFKGSNSYNFSSSPMNDLVYKTLKKDVLSLFPRAFID